MFGGGLNSEFCTAVVLKNLIFLLVDFLCSIKLILTPLNELFIAL